MRAEAALEFLPVLRPEQVIGGVLEKDASDIDVDALLQGFLRGARKNGSSTVYGADITGMQRSDGMWQVTTANGSYQAPVIVNAAGAWADLDRAAWRARAGRDGAQAPLGFHVRAARRHAKRALAAVPGCGAVVLHQAGCRHAARLAMQCRSGGAARRAGRRTRYRHRHRQYRTIDDIAHPPSEPCVGGLAQLRRPTANWSAATIRRAGFFWAAGQGGYGIQSAPAAGKYYAACTAGRGPPLPPTPNSALTPRASAQRVSNPEDSRSCISFLPRWRTKPTVSRRYQPPALVR
jgi:D-arginine dehydrogenase